MEEFKKHLKSLGLSDNSIMDDMSRINIMAKREIDFKKDHEYVKTALEKTNLSLSTISSCLRLCKRYHEFLSKQKLGVVEFEQNYGSLRDGFKE